MALTAAGLIASALFQSGVVGKGQVASAEDQQVALDALNDMLNDWTNERLMVISEVDMSVACNGQATFSVGPGGDINTVRPGIIEYAYIRQTSQNGALASDYPLVQINSINDYSSITAKGVQSLPSFFYYSPTMPKGTIYLYPQAQISQGYELHVVLRQPLGTITLANIQNTIQLPDEWSSALRNNLIMRINAIYEKPVNPAIAVLAAGALQTLRALNTDVATLDVGGHGRYNVYTDTFN